MTPPTASLAALEPRFYRVIPRSRGRRLDPARPAAVIVPPIALYVLTIATATALHVLATPAASGWTLLRAGVLAGVQLPLLHVVHAIADGAGLGRRGWSIVLAVGALLAIVLDALLPGANLHPITLAVIFLMSATTPPLGRAWRDLWVRYRPARVTLLASSEWGADEAVRRLEQIPGLSVTNVVIPGTNARTAERLLGRPTASTARSEMKLEKRVIVSCPLRDPTVGSTIAQLVALGHTIGSESAVFRAAEGRVDTEQVDPLNLLLSRPSHWLYDVLSRIANLLAAIVLLALLAPVFVLVAIAIAIESGRPFFYRQVRVGLAGRVVRVIKFRSMFQDAEKQSGPVWASEDDPRITRVGKFIRRLRLDELPQLVNVLMGDMALVGPRPERPHFFDQLRNEVPIFELRTCVRPGITGWAQVRAPYAAGVEDSRTKLEYDLYYVLHRSLWMDFAILLETFGVAFGGRGAR